MKRLFDVKNFDSKIVDVDMTKRTVSGYFARFNNVDSDGDQIKEGAFMKTIAESGPGGADRIRHLKNHDPNQMIGKIVELKEDGTGLYFTSIMSTNTHGKDALIEYQEGLLKEHSIGYQVMQSDQTKPEYNLLTEIKLWEGSAVTWGANPLTPVTGIKGLTDLSIDELQKRLDHVLKVCKVGELSDEYLQNVELNIVQLKQAIADKLEAEPIEEITKPSFDSKAIAEYLREGLTK